MEEYLKKEIESFQLDDDVDPARCARTIFKHIQLTVLNDKEEDNQEDDSGNGIVQERMKSLLEPVLLKYVDRVLADQATTTEHRETLDRLTELLSILTCSFEIYDSDDDKDSQSLMTAVLDRVELFTTASTDKFRGQACTLLGRMVFYLRRKRTGGNGDISDNVFKCLDRIESLLLPRLKDTHQSVRHSAIQAVGILLDPSSTTTKTTTTNSSAMGDDTIENIQTNVLATSAFPSALEELLWSMWHDPSVANRAEALLSVPIVGLDEDDGQKNNDDEENDDDEDEYPRSTIDQ